VIEDDAGAPIVVNYGGGANSFALLIGLHSRGVRPDAIVFADTGAEHKRTYGHMKTVVGPLLARWGWRDLVVVRWVRKRGPRQGSFVSITDVCRERRELPSRAYGLAGCSVKWKAQVIDSWVRSEFAAHGEGVRRMLGYDAGEAHRLGRGRGGWAWEYPLVEWGWDRQRCLDEIARAGFRQPGKSSCIFCPSKSPSEIAGMSEAEQDLALEIEDNARPNLTRLAGLGGRWAWRPVIEASRAQLPLPLGDDDTDPPEMCLECSS
jgi:hypothetical protein